MSETIDVGRKMSKHLSYRDLQERMQSGSSGDRTESIANIKHTLDQKGFTTPYLMTIRSFKRKTILFSIITGILALFVECFFIKTVVVEFKESSKVYVSTILGCLLSLIHLICACTNMVPSLIYDKSHQNAMIWVLPITITFSFAYLIYLVYECLKSVRTSLYTVLSILLALVMIAQVAFTTSLSS
ncbi:hypothetical protein WA588_002774 [Blastocystis sp. NMH]